MPDALLVAVATLQHFARSGSISAAYVESLGFSSKPSFITTHVTPLLEQGLLAREAGRSGTYHTTQEGFRFLSNYALESDHCRPVRVYSVEVADSLPE